MTVKILRCIVPTTLLLLASQAALAQNVSCAAMEANGQSWFSGQLTQAEALQQRGESAAAYDVLSSAQELPRRADVSLNTRCVGSSLWARFYKQRRVVTRSLGQEAERTGQPAHSRSALDWYLLGGNLEDAARAIEGQKATAKDCSRAGQLLGDQINGLDHARTSGFGLVADEVAARAFYQARRDDLIEWSRRQARDLLAREDAIVNGKVTEQEAQVESATEQARTLAAAMAGSDMLGGINEAHRDVSRAKQSLLVLREAQSWLSWISAAAIAPTRDRANLRGDALVARAANTATSLEARDGFLDAAGDYYAFSKDKARQGDAQRRRAAIAPALQAERAQRSTRLDASRAKLMKDAQEAQRALQMSDKEKKNFKSKADELEKELGL